VIQKLYRFTSPVRTGDSKTVTSTSIEVNVNVISNTQDISVGSSVTFGVVSNSKTQAETERPRIEVVDWNRIDEHSAEEEGQLIATFGELDRDNYLRGRCDYQGLREVKTLFWHK